MTRSGLIAAVAGVALASAAPGGVAVAQPGAGGEWAALASDRLASRVGDTLTVLIYESTSASDTAQNSATKATTASGSLATGVSHLVGQGTLNLASGYTGTGQIGRSDQMVGSISVVITQVLPNGDLRLAGDEALNINGERTRIKVRGRVRRADITSENTVLSTRLAEAEIEYSDAGSAARAAKPGLLSRLLTGFGLF